MWQGGSYSLVQGQCLPRRHCPKLPYQACALPCLGSLIVALNRLMRQAGAAMFQ